MLLYPLKYATLLSNILFARRSACLLARLSLPDIEWRLIYVSCPGNEELDQELDDCLVGPVPQGVNSFEFHGSAPQPSLIPPEDVLGVAALILTGSYKDQEFVRVGYYQNTEYESEELRNSPPSKIEFDKLVRDVNSKPRVTRFQIKWCVVQYLPVFVDFLKTLVQGCVTTEPERCCSWCSDKRSSTIC